MCKWKINRCECPVSYCTEGLDKYGSLEVEYYFSVPEKDAVPILETVCKAVSNGFKIEDGVMSRDLFGNVSVFFFTKSLLFEGKFAMIMEKYYILHIVRTYDRNKI